MRRLARAAAPVARSAQDARIRAQRDSSSASAASARSWSARSASSRARCTTSTRRSRTSTGSADATARIVKTLDAQLAAITTEVRRDDDEHDGGGGELASEEGRAAAPAGRHLQARAAVHDARRCSRRARSASWSRATSTCTCSRVRDRSLVARVETAARPGRASSDAISCTLRDALEENRERQAARGGAAARARARARVEASQQAQRRRKQIRGAPRAHRGDGGAADERDRVARGGRRRTAGGAARTRRAPASTLKTSDYGKLDWPVDGTLVYRFGKRATRTTRRSAGTASGIAARDRHAGAGRSRRARS